MSGGASEHRQGKVNMKKFWEDYAAGRVVQPVIGPILQGSDTDSPTVWVGFMDYVKCNNEGCGGHPRGVTLSYQRETGDAAGRRGSVDTGGGRIIKGDGDAVGGRVHRPPAGDSGVVSGPMPNS